MSFGPPTAPPGTSQLVEISEAGLRRTRNRGLIIAIGSFLFVADLPSGATLAFTLLCIVGFAIGMGPVFW